MKIYLETTIFNYYFDTYRDGHVATLKLFDEICTGKHEPYTSIYVIDELEKTPDDEKKYKMLNLIPANAIAILQPNNIAIQLADLYIKNNVIPIKFFTDALHIAMASVYELEMILSFNFKHIVKRKTRIFTDFINQSLGYRLIEISTPMEIVEDENS
ncbi:MAG: hypothetical protein LBS33_05725 [Streptococcaceae bacterium]|jgi:predicted nucleic acid-binding protein|nr:hypothetical protein [Streptococcaceae bacterium]